MYFPETHDTTPNDCIGREQEIIDFVEQHFVIDDIDKIRFQNETYHIKQFLPTIKQHKTHKVSTSFDAQHQNYGIFE